MAKSRVELQKLLSDLSGQKVYYNPPSTIQLQYPCIIYSRNRIQNKHANDQVYTQDTEYTLTVIDKNVLSPISDKVSKLPKCRFDRSFKTDNLNHDVFTIYY